MSAYPLASTVACEDMRYPISRCGDCPYHFYHPFYEEHIFNDSGSQIEIKTKESQQQSIKSRLQENSRESSPKRMKVPRNQTYAVNTALLKRPIRVPSLTKGKIELKSKLILL